MSIYYRLGVTSKIQMWRADLIKKQRKPNMIIDYNKSMGGVDKLDQFRSYYDVSGKKFWKYICNIITIINSCF